MRAAKRAPPPAEPPPPVPPPCPYAYPGAYYYPPPPYYPMPHYYPMPCPYPDPAGAHCRGPELCRYAPRCCSAFRAVPEWCGPCLRHRLFPEYGDRRC